MRVALGELQEAAGGDQRITATASILSSIGSAGVEAVDGNRRWLGVWNNSTTDHMNPTASHGAQSGSNDDGFIEWLVSGNSDGVSDQVGYPSAVLDTNESIILFDSDDIGDDVRVPLVETLDEDTAYAFWIEDEGVKASVKPLPQASNTVLNDDAYANPLVHGLNYGIDYGRMGGGMESAITYPISSTSNDDLIRAMQKVQSDDELGLTASEDNTWVNANRHEFTIYSHSLMTDVRNGGFKQDLSLAFEMDGALQGPNGLSYFNNSDFVGDSGNREVENTLTGAISQAPGHDFYSRYVYAHFPYGTASTVNKARGPTWHLLRDYYNLYKRLDQSSGNLTLNAQPFYPNNPEVQSASNAYDFLEGRFAKGGDPFVQEFTDSGGRYLYHLSRGNYTPVMLGYRLIFSVASYEYDSVADTAKIAFAFDPVYYLWNPYDKSIRFENYKVEYNEEIPVTIEFEVTDNNGTRAIDEVLLTDYLIENGWDGSSDKLYSFLMDPAGDVVLAPGEVRLFSASGTNGDCYPGVTNITATSGNILRLHPEAGEILVDGVSAATIKVNLGITTKTAGTDAQNGRFRSTSYLVDDDDLANARTGTQRSTHLKTQFVSIQTNSAASAGEQVDVVELTFDGASLSSRKSWLGYLDYLMKPTNTTAEPTEIMAAFNPLSVSSIGDIRVFPQRNRYLHLISEPSLNVMLPESFGDSGFWGYEYSSAGSNYIPAFSLPSEPMTSLAQLRNGMLTPYIFENPRAVGNSYANPRLRQDELYGDMPGPQTAERYDSTWLLNDALWDKYYFSGIAPAYSYSSGAYAASENLEAALTRFFEQDPDRYGNANLIPNIATDSTPNSIANQLTTGDGYKEIGASMLMQGGFNVNSTSVAAWAAVLGGNRDMTIDYFAADSLSEISDTATGIPFLKSQRPNGDSGDAWAGFSRVNPNLIWNDQGTPNDESDDTGLAAEIVKQVRLRGPFMSLSDFVNRRLDTDQTGRMGALQAAIKATGLNSDIENNEGVPADYSTYYENSDAGTGFTSGGINGFIEQADILQAIGPKLVARSDTFRIRAYGESRTLNGDVASQATCEVVVQRLPEYVDEANDAFTLPEDLSASNNLFGRRFKIVSFKWL
ncbi:hypothetical protein [Thalassobacterium sedimentorum]|nr:hypothetical protein [Coraliomargarita sp. SDUM461004]